VIESVDPETGSIVNVAGPAMIIGLMDSPVGLEKVGRIATGCRSLAVSTTALMGVAVGVEVGVGVGVAVTISLSF
jgi:hypothetical protein